VSVLSAAARVISAIARHGTAAVARAGVRPRAFLAAVSCAVFTAVPAEVHYPEVLPGKELVFPDDEGSHPAYRVEWWYVTGQLEDEQDNPLGFQVTFFRVRPGLAESNPSRFAPSQILFAHAAIADLRAGRLRHDQRAARAGFDLAYAREGRTDVRLDQWQLREEAGAYHALVQGEDFNIELRLTPTQEPMLQGDRGYSRKGSAPRSASYYYSLPQLAVDGEIAIEGQRQRVTGRAWLDHEWSGDFVEDGAQGWDWVGINLDDGGSLMAFQMRDKSGAERWAAATLRAADGTQQSFAPEAVEWTPGQRWRSPRTGAVYAVGWQLRIGDARYRVAPLINDAELDSRATTGLVYWEGPVRLLREDGSPAGSGYLEMTGYADRIGF
jgi:predicted secreted hydrolase